MTAAVWRLAGEPATVGIAEPWYRPEGPLSGWREVSPRPRDSFLTRLFAGGELHLFPDGTAEVRPASGVPLSGTWRRTDGVFLLLTTRPFENRREYGVTREATLDGYLTAGDGDGWLLDAVYTGPGRIGSVIARVGQRFVPSGGRPMGAENLPGRGRAAAVMPEREVIAMPEREAVPSAEAPPSDGRPAPTAAIEELRRSLDGSSLYGRWRGGPRPGNGRIVIGPAEGEHVGSGPAGGECIGSGSAGGEHIGFGGDEAEHLRSGPAGGEYVGSGIDDGLGGRGFLRWARGPDVAVGLVDDGTGRGRELVILERDDEPSPVAFETGDRAGLRRLGIELLTDGRYGQASPILDLAAGLYARDGHAGSILIDLLGLSDARMRCAFARSDFGRLPGLLVAATELRREVTLGPGAFNPWLDALGFLRSTAEGLHETLFRVADLADAYRRRSPDGRGATPEAEALCAAAKASAAATGAVRDVLRDLGSHSDDPETIETSAARVDRVLAGGQDALRAAADRLVAEGTSEARSGTSEARSGSFVSQENLTAHETVTLAARDGAETLGLLRRHLDRSDPASAARFVRDQARQTSHLTAGYVEIWRALLDDHWEKILSTELALPFYERMVPLLLDLDVPEDALVASEMSRARAFADTLREGRTESGRPPRGLGGAVPVSRAALRDILAGHDATVVEYFLAGDLLAIWVCPRGGPVTLISRRIDRAGLTEAVDEFGRLARIHRHDAGSRAAMADVLRRLGAVLWDVIPAGLLPADPDEPVTVVPHAELFRVPFAALRDEPGTYLVDRHAIRVLPALALAPDLSAPSERRSPNGPPSLVALVNPAPLAEGLPLHLTERHFNAIADLYGEHAGRLHTGAEASLATLREVAGEGTVMYFGTHAQAVTDRDSDPLASYLVLAPSPGHDGILRARDVPALGLAADLVILAACETGAGAVTADGIIGLSRAFLTSGPTGLITTLYRVGERAGLDLMIGFHEAWLLDGLEPVSALRRAQARAASEQPASAREPHLWAAFTFFGLGSHTRALSQSEPETRKATPA
ncbi:CHAT domain-containing protein [Streptosporangium subroseum]|uniref:CHAT domain-containing protein n=1 Tax=Streptosporangium subroseum TaxID=106412 RepID=UPI00308498BF|nr:CHAT domain-containing protein [Streptosporangium subroseum]